MNHTTATKVATVEAGQAVVAVVIRRVGVGVADGKREREQRESSPHRSSLVTIPEQVENPNPNIRNFGDTKR